MPRTLLDKVWDAHVVRRAQRTVPHSRVDGGCACPPRQLPRRSPLTEIQRRRAHDQRAQHGDHREHRVPGQLVAAVERALSGRNDAGPTPWNVTPIQKSKRIVRE